MSAEKFDQLPVMTKDGAVAGVVKLASIKSKLLAVSMKLFSVQISKSNVKNSTCFNYG
jgi:hypothetical protein